MTSSGRPPLPISPTPPTSTLAVVSLVTGILAWILLPFIASIVAIITGHMAKNEIKKSAGGFTGDGLATAGLALGYVQLGLSLCICLPVIVLTAVGLLTIPFSFHRLG